MPARRTILAVLLLAAGSVASAQDRPSPPAPGLTGGADWEGQARPRVLPEGVFLTSRQGRLIAGPRGYRVFVPSAADRQPGEGPMLLAPNQTLARAVASLGDNAEVAVSGQVLLYHGKNYLLASAISRLGVAASAPQSGTSTAPDAAPDSAPDNAPAAGASPTVAVTTPPTRPVRPGPGGTPASASDDPEVAALLAELDDERLAARFMPSPPAETTSPLPAAGEGDAPAMAEGTMLTRRRGRLVRQAGGEWALSFDSDPDSAATEAAAEDEPLTILPCRLLMDLERRVMRAGGEGTAVVVSGRVHTYGPRRYLMPTIVRFQPEWDLTPRQ